MTSIIKVTFITIVIKVTWTRGRSAHSLAPYSGSPSTRPRHIQSFDKQIFDMLCPTIWMELKIANMDEFLNLKHKSYEHIVTWGEKAHPHLWWFPLLVLQRGRWWCSLARPNVGWTLGLGNKKPRQLSFGRIITWVHQNMESLLGAAALKDDFQRIFAPGRNGSNHQHDPSLVPAKV